MICSSLHGSWNSLYWPYSHVTNLLYNPRGVGARLNYHSPAVYTRFYLVMWIVFHLSIRQSTEHSSECWGGNVSEKMQRVPPRRTHIAMGLCLLKLSPARVDTSELSNQNMPMILMPSWVLFLNQKKQTRVCTTQYPPTLQSTFMTSGCEQVPQQEQRVVLLWREIRVQVQCLLILQEMPASSRVDKGPSSATYAWRSGCLAAH